MNAVLAIKSHLLPGNGLAVALVLLLKLFDLRHDCLHFDAGLRLFAADRVHQAANQNGEQDDAHAVTRNDEMQLVKEPVHQVGEEDEDLRPDPKIASVGKRVEMKP